MRNFRSVRRVIVKVGTNVLTHQGTLDRAYIAELAAQVALVVKGGRNVCLVTSGAIGFGASALNLTGPVKDVVLRQACAAVGQPLLMQAYRESFSRHGLEIAQVLLTREVLNNRISYVKLRNAVERLLEMGIVPVFNENDSVATAEIGTAFGDNDQLSALIASKVDAELLILLSDIDGYYDADPRRNPHAVRLDSVEHVTPEMITAAGEAGSQYGTGGMVTKLKAVQIAADGGCRVVLAHGKDPDILNRILSGESVGTVFTARRNLKNRSRWILHSEPRGWITVDGGALAAIRNHNSLLPTGITAVSGLFESGEVVMVNDVVKIVSGFSSAELTSLIGKHSSEIRAIVGDGRKNIARPEDMVFLDEDGE